jgi:hypothetical protein
VSSILEALRELEGRRPPAGPTASVATPVEQPTAVNRVAETLGIAAIGLVLGALGFLLFIGLSGLMRAPTSQDDPPPTSASEAPAAAPAPRGRGTGTDPVAAARPAWLETADPPRARVEPNAPATPEEPVRTAAERPARQAGGAPTGAAPVEIVGIDYSPDGARRAATLRLDGTVVKLHERESAHGVEVQLIERDGVYVRRGADVFMVAPAR